MKKTLTIIILNLICKVSVSTKIKPILNNLASASDHFGINIYVSASVTLVNNFCFTKNLKNTYFSRLYLSTIVMLVLWKFNIISNICSNICNLTSAIMSSIFFLSFLSRTFTIHRTAGEEGGCFFKLSLPLPSVLQTLRH